MGRPARGHRRGNLTAGFSIALVLMLLQGCSDETGATMDGSVDASGTDHPFASPTLPTAPRLTPCPAGYREVDAAPDVRACDPTPEGGIPSCAAGQGWFLGESGCVDVGAPCPVGDFGDGLPDTGVIFINPEAPLGGGGTRTAPYRTLADVPTVPTGATVALSKGVHRGSITLRAGVQIVGACAGATSIASPTFSNTQGVFTTRSRGVELRNMTIARSERPAIVALGDSAGFTVEGVIIEEPRLAGVLGLSADLTLREVVVRSVRPSSGFSRGVDIERGGTLRLERVTVRGATVGTGVYAGDPGSRLEASDIVVGGVASRGLSLETGATGTLQRVVVDRAGFIGLFVGGGDVRATGSDVLLRDPTSNGEDEGRGITVEGGQLEVQRLWLDGARELGAVALEPGSSLSIRDGLIQRITGRADGTRGMGAAGTQGARIELDRVIVEHARVAGVAVTEGVSSTSLVDVTVRHIQGEAESGMFGRGIDLESGVNSGQRVLVEDVIESGVLVNFEGTRAAFEDLTVRDVHSETATGIRGVGVSSQSGGVFEGDRVLIEDVRHGGFLSLAGGHTRLADVLVRRVARPRCAGETGECAVPLAVGVGSVAATVDLSRFAVEDATDCGFQVAFDGSIDASEGLVTGSSIGACIQVEGYDLARLSTSVRYRDNDSTLESTSLPVPDPAEPVGQP